MKKSSLAILVFAAAVMAVCYEYWPRIHRVISINDSTDHATVSESEIDCAPWDYKKYYAYSKLVFSAKVLSVDLREGFMVMPSTTWKGSNINSETMLHYSALGRYRSQLKAGNEYVFFLTSDSPQKYVLEYCDYTIDTSTNPDAIKFLIGMGIH